MYDIICIPDYQGLTEPPRLIRWLFTEGSLVASGQILAEVEADKLAAAIEAPEDGVLVKCLCVPRAVIPIGEPLAIFWKGPLPTEGLPQIPDGLEHLTVHHPSYLSTGSDLPTHPLDSEIDLVEGDPECMTSLRKTIARRMAHSHTTIPCFHLTTSVDMTACAELRSRMKKEGKKATYNDMTIKAAALALLQRPALLSVFSDGQIWPRRSINIGFAAITEDDGLVVPVIHSADTKPLADIAGETRLMSARARQRKLTNAECAGGVFSVSNLGGFDIDHFIALVNPGESGILAIGKVAMRPLVQDGLIEARLMMTMTLSADHRVIDGAEGARFNEVVKHFLEHPEKLL